MKRIMFKDCDCCPHPTHIGSTRRQVVPTGTHYMLPLLGPAWVALAQPNKGLVNKGFYFKWFGDMVVVVTLRSKVKL